MHLVDNEKKKDVAQFMRVNESTGLHFFDGSFRPVPLEQTFIGVKPKGFQKQRQVMTEICFENIVQTLKKGLGKKKRKKKSAC